MRLARVKKNEVGEAVCVFMMVSREREYLMETLRLYPSLDLYLQPISKSGVASAEAQKLLDEAAADLREARRKKLGEFMSSASFLKREDSGRFQMVLSGEDREWLLQVLNEIRVGCWISLGRPDMDQLPVEDMTIRQAQLRMAMDVSGYFQMELLQA
jgi:hypothetical protein